MAEHIVPCRLKAMLVLLLNEYGIVDISVGAEKFFCVSRETLLKVAKAIDKEKYYYHIHRFRKNGNPITVLSCFSRNATNLGLEDRFNYIEGANALVLKE